MYLIHPSSVGKIMTEPKSIDPDLLTAENFKRLEIGADLEEYAAAKKAVAAKRTECQQALLDKLMLHSLSVGAKTYLKSIVREISYDFRSQIDAKYLTKGTMCEDEAIKLVNLVYFENYTKHSGRVSSDLMTGECDILAPDCVRDIKNAWSLETFPVFIEDAHSDIYEWQGRAYLHLYDSPTFYLDWCLVDTPDELIRWEQPELHKVSHIDPMMRVTTVRYDRDMKLEARMLVKCREAQLYIERMKKQLLIDHNYTYEV